MRADKAKKFADKRASGAAGPKGPRVGLNVLDDIRTTPTGMQDGRGHMTKIKGEGTRMTQYDNVSKIRDGKKKQKQTLDGHYSVDRVALQRLLNAEYEGGARPNYYEDGPSKKKSSGSHQMPDGSMMRGAKHSVDPYLAAQRDFQTMQGDPNGAAGPAIPLDKRGATSMDFAPPPGWLYVTDKMKMDWLNSRALLSKISGRYLKDPTNLILPNKKELANGAYGGMARESIPNAFVKGSWDPKKENNIYWSPSVEPYDLKQRDFALAHEAGHAYDNEHGPAIGSYYQVSSNPKYAKFNKNPKDQDPYFPFKDLGAGEQYANDFAQAIGYTRSTGGRPAATLARMRKARLVPQRKMKGR